MQISNFALANWTGASKLIPHPAMFTSLSINFQDKVYVKNSITKLDLSQVQNICLYFRGFTW